jgi:DNA polymerase, archaea type
LDLSCNANSRDVNNKNAISLITNVLFDRVCHTGISAWWIKILNDKICNGECRNPTLNLEERKKKKNYKGGYIIDPKIGYYHKESQAVYVLDVKSLYPAMMINNNISFDTVNCSCCKVNPKAQVTQEIIDLISDDDKNNKKQYWICKNYRGIIPRL